MRNSRQAAFKIGCPHYPVRLGLVLLCLLLEVWSHSARGQTYSMVWNTMAAGGGTSTGGVYSVSVTMGQSAASGTMVTGGDYALAGGFWPGLVVPSTTGAPTLFIQVSGKSLIISWSPVTPGFVLEETTSLASPAWSPGPTGNPTAPIPAASQATFYRLRQR